VVSESREPRQASAGAEALRRRGEERQAVVDLPAGVLREIVRQAEAGYPEEICGMIIGRPGAPQTYQARQVANIANRELQEDPTGLARDARTSYKMDPLEQLRVLREVDGLGWDVRVFYHSHPDHDAYFSRMDRDRALTPEGEPLWPGAAYLVVSVIAGEARSAAVCRWDPAHQTFWEQAIALPSGPVEQRPE
jgi:proteasome lid subunit RPN8/RPN11